MRLRDQGNNSMWDRSDSRLLLTFCLLLPLLLSACSRRGDAPDGLRPGLNLKISVAPRGTSAPIVGAVDTLRIMAFDATGAALIAPVVIAIAPGQRTFQAVVDVPAGSRRSLAVFAHGRRDLSGGDGPPTSDRGVLYRDRVGELEIESGSVAPPTRIDVLLRPFVPVPEEPELLAGARHRVRWSRVRGATRYELVQTLAGAPRTIATQDTLFEGDGLPATYRVRAVGADGEIGAFSDYVEAALPPPPPAPTGLMATGVSASRIDLVWAPVVATPPVSYDVERRTEPETSFLSLAAGLVDASYSDDTARPDLSYHYRVRAVGRGGPSGWSAEASATTLPALPGPPQNLIAEATAPTSVQLGWSRGTGVVTEHVIERKSPGGTFEVLASVGAAVLSHVDRGVVALTRYEYRVLARNASGLSTPSNVAVATTPAAAPVAPTIVSAVAVSPTRIDVTWLDNSADETGFEVERAVGAGGAFAFLVMTPPNTTGHQDPGVTESTTYRYRVRSRLDDLASDWSDEAVATTPRSIPASPSALTAEALSSSTIRLAWVDNAANEESFRVESKNSLGDWETAASAPANATMIDITGLADARTYTYRVRALNSAGASEPSNEASATTPPATPAAPTNLTAQAAAFNRVTLRWTDNSDNETGFEIRRQAGASDVVLIDVGPDVDTFSDTGVTGGTTYDYSVRARNGSAASAYAGPASVTTPTGPPGIPGTLSATVIGSSQVQLNWSASSGIVNFYDLESRIPPAAFGAFVTVIGQATSHTATNLLSGTTYEFRIKARNSVGSSDFGNVVRVTTPDAPPTAPTNLAGNASGSHIVRLSWTDTSHNEETFEVEERVFGASSFVAVAGAPADATTVALTGRSAATRYDYRVRAVNAAGPSGYSNIVSVATPDTIPAAPLTLAAAALSSSRASISWAPGLTEGSISSFEIERRLLPGSFDLVSAVSATTTQIEDGGLTPGATYDYRARARNGLGASPYSNIASVTLPIDPPGVPSGFSGAALSFTAIRVNWTPGPGGAAATFEIESRVSGTTPFTGRFVVGGSAGSFDVTNLTIDTFYDFRIRAVNTSGTSDWSAIIMIQTLDTPPPAPANLTATQAGPTFRAVLLQWTDNSTREDGFLIQTTGFDTTAAWTTLVTLGANVTVYQYTPSGSPSSPSPLPGPLGCTTRNYRIRAFNQGGSSGWSNIANICN